MRVFVVDDDDDLVEILRRLFFSAGYEVVSASSAKEAIELAKQARPDLVVLDVMMEDMYAGLRVARFLREPHSELAHVPILMLTSIHMRGDLAFREQATGLIREGDSLLEKPVALESLLKEAQRLVSDHGPD